MMGRFTKSRQLQKKLDYWLYGIQIIKKLRVIIGKMMRRRSIITTLALVLAAYLMAMAPSYAQSDNTALAVRLIQQRCVQCHGGEEVNADVDFSGLRDDLDVWTYRKTYVKALDMLTRDKMPPGTEPPLPESIRANLIEWLGHTLENVDVDRIPRDPGFLPPRRLNRHEYNYTVQDLFGIDARPADVLPADQVIGDAFDNNAATLSIEPLWFERALTAANTTVRAVWSDSGALDRLLFVRPTPPLIEEKALYVSTNERARKLDMGDGDFTVFARVKGTGGHIITKAPPLAGFTRGSKQLSFGKDKITYQISRGREIRIEDLNLDDGNAHSIALSVQDHRASLFLDGRLLASVADFSKPDREDHLFKVGMPAPKEVEEEERDEARKEEKREEEEDEASDGQASYPGIEDLRFYSKAVSEETILNYTAGRHYEELPEAAFHWHPGKESPRPEIITARQAAAEVLDSFLGKVFRRPPTEDESARYLTLFLEGVDSGVSFDLAMQVPIAAALSSPSYLLRSEEARHGEEPYAVSSIDMASRLSFFLWSSAPDEELISAGVAGRLVNSDELLRQTDRMLADEKAIRFFERFVVQWLRTEGLGDTFRPDADRFPEVSDSLMAAMRQEGVMVFGDIIRENRSLLRLLDDQSTFMNQELASHYGYEELVTGPEWQKVQLRNSARGGLLTQAAVLTVSSSPRRTSPVFRGKWVLDVLLGEPPPSPPPNIPPLPAEAEIAGASVRELLEAHRSQPECAACHDRMDPYGLALEQYDAVGRLRTDKQNTFTTLFNGETLDGATDLRRFLVEAKGSTFIRHLTKKLLAYALGRELTLPDERSVYTILQRLENESFQARTLIHEIVLSEPFRYRRNP